MIGYEEALALVQEHITPDPIVTCDLGDSLGMVLAKPAIARFPSPRFDASAVDGYAIELASFDGTEANSTLTLPIVGESNAGKPSRSGLKRGTAMRIFTGARVPAGAESVVMQEQVRVEGRFASFDRRPKDSANIRRQGSEFARGARLFEAGRLVTPSVIGTLAALGMAKLKVFDKPKVAVVVSGDELRLPGAKLRPGEISDSSSFALVGALRALGIDTVRVIRVRDDPKRTVSAVGRALDVADFVLTTGGVSVGEHDYMRSAYEAGGVEEIFWRVRLKPGMPLYFGMRRDRSRKRNQYVFGLPGNPVSVLVTYQLFVRDALLRSMGYLESDRRFVGRLTHGISKAKGRTEFVRARSGSLAGHTPEVVPLAQRESNMTSGMANADSLIVFPEDEEYLAPGTEVRVIPIRWSPL